jgi:hypothetical protein
MLHALVSRTACAGGMSSGIGRRRDCRRTFSESHSTILARGQSPLYLSHQPQVLRLRKIQRGQVLPCTESRRQDNKSVATLGSLAVTSLELDVPGVHGCGLMPTPRVEPRYLTVSLFVLGVHLRISTRNLVLTCMANVAVNAVTIYVFMFRTFEAPDGSLGRFVW